MTGALSFVWRSQDCQRILRLPRRAARLTATGARFVTEADAQPMRPASDSHSGLHAPCMRRACETLCPYERTYERENTNAVLKSVQESKIQRITRTAYARAMLTTVPTFVPLLCASSYHSRPSSRSRSGQKSRSNRACLVSHGLERSRLDGLFTIAKHEVVGSKPITRSISSLISSTPLRSRPRVRSRSMTVRYTNRMTSVSFRAGSRLQSGSPADNPEPC